MQWLLPAVFIFSLHSVAVAQLIEDIELRREGPNAIANIRFVTAIQYQRTVVSRAGDLAQAFYDVLPSRERPDLVTSQRRVVGGGGFPQLVVTDEGVDRGNLSRKLIVRFSAPTRFRVRAGRGNRSIEIVMEGLAPVVPAARARPVPPALAEAETTAAALLSTAQAAYDRADYAAALDPLNQLLNLPPNASSRRAQELVGLSRLKGGDTARARAEFELFLNLYPSGADSDRVRQLLAGLPKLVATPEAEPAPPPPEPNWSGSLSTFYFGGQSKVRTQEFQDSPISGLPPLASDNTISATDQSQVQTNVDLNWRSRDADSDTRFVFRDAYTADFRANGKSRNRLSALYLDRRSFVNGTSFRVGRQSPLGGGILYRFDGLQAGYTFRPKWKLNAAVGAPSEDLLDTRRRFHGAWIEAEQLTSELSGSLYFNQQVIDGEVDRRALGTELRYFSGGVSASGQLDYDTVIKGINIASIQATWQLPDTTVFNFLYDYRATPLLSLGNTLFFQDPNRLTPARRIQDLLATTSLATLREQVKGVTAYQTQALAGVTTPLGANWQIGADVRLTNVGEVRPVPVVLPNGQPSTGNLWSVGAQLIGSNLYSSRDTHVFNASVQRGPTFHGTLLTYNNLSSLGAGWQLEPSLKYYRQTDTAGVTLVRWTPGLRVTYRVLQQVSLESELSYERSKSTSAARNEASARAFYYLGVRYDF
ncbi:MAG: hypothetical protein ACREMA_05920 [Longimicrobiales bacterium]